jgi:Uncharacterized conserved protein
MFIKNNRRSIIIISVILIASVYLTIKFGSDTRNIDELTNYIRSFGAFAAVIFVALFNLKTILVVFPYSIFVLLGGTIFGSVNGILLSMLSVATSSSLAFFIARLLGKDKMKKFLKGRFAMLDEKTNESGFNIMLFMRLSCLFPADALSYAAGLTQMKFSHFFVGTMIGFLPEVISITMLGDNIKKPMSKEFLMSVGLIIVTATLSIVIQKIINTSKKQDA